MITYVHAVETVQTSHTWDTNSTYIYSGTFGTLSLILITEVSSFQRWFNTLQYYTGTQNGLLITEVSTFQRFVIESSHCVRGCYREVACIGVYWSAGWIVHYRPFWDSVTWLANTIHQHTRVSLYVRTTKAALTHVRMYVCRETWC